MTVKSFCVLLVFFQLHEPFSIGFGNSMEGDIPFKYAKGEFIMYIISRFMTCFVKNKIVSYFH